jgi:hypothetical protein
MSEKIRWEDIKSPLVPGNQYFDKITNPSFLEIYRTNFEKYKPNVQVLNQIKEWFSRNHEELRIVILGAEWCPDCQRNGAALLKIELEIKEPNFKLFFLSGVKTNPLRRTKTDIHWAVPPSPPEVNEPKFAVKAIPMIYLFLRDGRCKGFITENPSHTKTVEGEIQFYLNSVD